MSLYPINSSAQGGQSSRSEQEVLTPKTLAKLQVYLQKGLPTQSLPPSEIPTDSVELLSTNFTPNLPKESKILDEISSNPEEIITMRSLQEIGYCPPSKHLRRLNTKPIPLTKAPQSHHLHQTAHPLLHRLPSFNFEDLTLPDEPVEILSWEDVKGIQDNWARADK